MTDVRPPSWLAEFLGVELPPQAVPQRFIRIDALPLLPAGKPNLAALARRAEA